MGKTLSRPKGPRRPPKGVSELLDSPGWQKLNSASQPVKGGVKMKLELIDGAGLPPMHLISAVTLETLGTFPRNQDGHTKDAREVLAPGAHAVIMLFSHRWLDPDGGFIDDSNGTKMLALLEFVKWYRSKYPTRELHFWIDYCCIGWSVVSLLPDRVLSSRGAGRWSIVPYLSSQSSTDLDSVGITFDTHRHAHTRAHARTHRAHATRSTTGCGYVGVL